MIKIKNLTLIKENRKILDSINLEMEFGEEYVIIGKSGSSKTSLCNSIMEFEKHDKNIFFDSKYLRGIDISMIFQDFASCLNPLVKVKNQIIESLIYYDIMNKKNAILEAKKIIKKLNLNEEILEKYPYELSGGQKQRVVIATCLITKPKILICDEITSGLDVLNANDILDILSEYKCLKIIVTHNIDIMKRFSRNIIYMKNGKIARCDNLINILKIENDEYIDSLIKMEKLKNDRSK